MTDVLPLMLGVGWGALVATPIVRWARRSAVVTRLATRAPTATASAPRPWLGMAVLERWFGPVSAVVVGVVERRAAARRDAELIRDLPMTIDLLAVAVGAGCTPYLAVEVASQWAPAPLARCLEEVRHDCALGVSFATALERMASAYAPLGALTDALLASEHFGAPVGDALARLAIEERAALRRRAETRARTVPVRMLFPLVFLVLPAFALLSVVPVLLAGLSNS